MSKNVQSPEEQSFLQMLEEKSRARNKQVAAVYAASAADLEHVAVSIKAALRGAGPIARPRRFSSLND